jgi:predicted secreted protein
MPACAVNVLKGKVAAILLMRNIGDTAWEIVGGVNTRSVTLDNPVEGITNQSTSGDFTESEWTGYSTLSISASGVFDDRDGESRTIEGTAYNIAKVSKLAVSAWNATRSDEFLIIMPDKNIEGCFNITNFESSGDQEGLATFSISLQSKETPTVTFK